MKTTEKYQKLMRSMDLDEKVYPKRVIKIKTWVLFLALILVDAVIGYYALVNLIDSYTLSAYIFLTIVIMIGFALLLAAIIELDREDSMRSISIKIPGYKLSGKTRENISEMKKFILIMLLSILVLAIIDLVPRLIVMFLDWIM